MLQKRKTYIQNINKGANRELIITKGSTLVDTAYGETYATVTPKELPYTIISQTEEKSTPRQKSSDKVRKSKKSTAEAEEVTEKDNIVFEDNKKVDTLSQT